MEGESPPLKKSCMCFAKSKESKVLQQPKCEATLSTSNQRAGCNHCFLKVTKREVFILFNIWAKKSRRTPS